MSDESTPLAELGKQELVAGYTGLIQAYNKQTEELARLKVELAAEREAHATDVDNWRARCDALYTLMTQEREARERAEIQIAQSIALSRRFQQYAKEDKQRAERAEAALRQNEVSDEMVAAGRIEAENHLMFMERQAMRSILAAALAARPVVPARIDAAIGEDKHD
jgi:septal ring factor EnvC (AmiA/AmiB activator)